MRKVFFTSLLGIALALTGCKKENKDAAPAGSAAAGSGSAGSAAPAGDTGAKTVPPSGDPAPSIAPGEPPAVENAAPADPGPRPAALTDDDIALADRLIGTLEKMATSINSAGSDCPKVASAIKAMSNEMNSVAEEGKKLDARISGDADAKKWFEATYGPKVMGTMSKVMNNSCFGDKDVQAAMANIKGL